MRFLLIICMMIMLGCASTPGSENAIYVSADISDLHRCSRISPEIEVDDIPKYTVSFDVSLEDRADLSRIHGGGIWNNDGSGVIPEGALTRHYLGACPPAGTSREYQFVVKALSDDGRLLGEGKYIFEQE